MRRVLLAMILLAPSGPAQEPAPKVSIEAGLRWLAQEQDPGTGGWKGNDPKISGPDPESTALAILAFVGSGFSPWPGEREDKTFSESLRLGVEALARMQGEDGLVGARSRLHGHALATAAFAEVCRYSRREEVLQSARKSVACLLRARIDGSGWGGKHADQPLTILCLLALHSARKAGLEVDAKAEAEAREWLLSSVDPRNGVATMPESKFKGVAPPPVVCAAGVYLACHWAGTAEENRAARTALTFVGVRPPPRTLNDDMYDLFLGSLAMSCYGRETSAKWLEAAEAELAKRQEGPALKRLAGSADAIGPMSRFDGRVAGTAVLVLTAQVARRMPRAIGLK
jgi:hypothetical protein